MSFKIYIPSHWNINKEDLYNLYCNLSPGKTGNWNNIQLTKNINDCDFVLIQDKCNENIPLDKKVIFFGREPKAVRFYQYNEPNLFLSFHHENNNTWLPQTWWLSYSYDYLTNLKITDLKKTKNISVIDSGKQLLLNHKIRVKTITKYAEKYPIDVYGNINNNPLPARSKESGLLDYRYNLCIENCNTDYYFSEKIIDPLLAWTMPIYYGCNKISKFLPPGSYIEVNPNDSSCVDQIKDIVSSDYFEQNIDAIAEARNLILNQYNLLPTLHRAVNNKKIL